MRIICICHTKSEPDLYLDIINLLTKNTFKFVWFMNSQMLFCSLKAGVKCFLVYKIH